MVSITDKCLKLINDVSSIALIEIINTFVTNFKI